jgi:hypothetical protein
MRIPIGYIVAFLIGCGVLLLINFVQNQRTSNIKSNSGLYPMIYKSIEEKEAALRSISSQADIVDAYKKKLLAATSDMNSLSLSALSRGARDASTPLLVSLARNARDQVQKVFELTRFDNPTTDKAALEVKLSSLSVELSNAFGYTFNLLWAPALGYDTDSLEGTPQGKTFLRDVRDFMADSGTLTAKRQQMASLLKSKADELDGLKARVTSDREELTASILGLNGSMEDIEKSSKDRMLMYVVIPLFGLIVVLLMVLPYIYRDNSVILERLFEQKVILQIFTVFILVMTILLLGIGNKINAETLGTLLGGVSVYILQKSMDGTAPHAKTPPDAS